MAMVRGLYPKDWDVISGQVKWDAHFNCSECHKQCRLPGEPFDSHERTLTTAHLSHEPCDCPRRNLKALCVTCHFRHDASANQRKRWFQVRIDGGAGHVGRQLHMFVQGLAIGRVINGRAENNRETISTCAVGLSPPVSSAQSGLIA